MARYSSFRRSFRSRRRPVRKRTQSYWQSAKRVGSKLARGAGYVAAAGAASMAAVALYRNYPELVQRLQAMGYSGAGLVNAAYDYLKGAAATAQISGENVAARQYARANDRWEAYKVRTRPFEWGDYLDQFERPVGTGIAADHTRAWLGAEMAPPEYNWSDFQAAAASPETRRSSRLRQRRPRLSYEMP